MARVLRIEAPAKLNLFLEVLARRDDGFHEVETLMVAINIFDTLYFATETGNRIQLQCEHAVGHRSRLRRTGESAGGLGDLPGGSDNIVWRAVDLLRQRAGREFGARIRLIKRIPSAAGLGGASSDAAAALLAANEAWQLGWSRSRLAAVAAELGSDVPFFLGAGAARCVGRGERVEPLGTIPSLPLVVVRPQGGLSTKDVYSQCEVPDTPRGSELLRRAMFAGDRRGLAGQLFNRLQTPAERLSPWVERTRAAFRGLGCWGHQMSGSGTSYFGICQHARHARRVAAILRSRNLGWVETATTISHPLSPRPNP